MYFLSFPVIAGTRKVLQCEPRYLSRRCWILKLIVYSSSVAIAAAEVNNKEDDHAEEDNGLVLSLLVTVISSVAAGS